MLQLGRCLGERLGGVLGLTRAAGGDARGLGDSVDRVGDAGGAARSADDDAGNLVGVLIWRATAEAIACWSSSIVLMISPIRTIASEALPVSR